MSTTLLPKPDGPLLVQGPVRLENRRGALETQATMALCRCGASGKKPFCDGTHKKIGFSSAKQADRLPDRRDDYKAGRLTIHDNRSICAHAGRCTDGLAKVFRYRQEPWIDASAATAEEIIAVVKRCPSGALSYTLEGKAPESTQGEAAIFVSPNGPYEVTGAVQLLETPEPAGAVPGRRALCRCGGSKNKPFCDGTHWSNGFADDKN